MGRKADVLEGEVDVQTQEQEGAECCVVFRCHDKTIHGPFDSVELAAGFCSNQGPCVILPGTFNAAWGE